MEPLGAPPVFMIVKSATADEVPMTTLPKMVLDGASGRVAGLSVKVGVTVVACVSVTVQTPVPLQPPPIQPSKVLFALGVAVSLTVVAEKLAVQVAPQSIPAGSDLTVPVPVPAGVIMMVMVPVPSSAAITVPPGWAVSVAMAWIGPRAVGVKRTPTMQLPAGSSIDVQFVDEMWKFVVSESAGVKVPVGAPPLLVTANRNSSLMPPTAIG